MENENIEILKRIEYKISFIGSLLIGCFTTALMVYGIDKAEQIGGLWGTLAPYILPVAWLIFSAWLSSEFKKSD